MDYSFKKPNYFIEKQANLKLKEMRLIDYCLMLSQNGKASFEYGQYYRFFGLAVNRENKRRLKAMTESDVIKNYFKSIQMDGNVVEFSIVDPSTDPELFNRSKNSYQLFHLDEFRDLKSPYSYRIFQNIILERTYDKDNIEYSVEELRNVISYSNTYFKQLVQSVLRKIQEDFLANSEYELIVTTKRNEFELQINKLILSIQRRDKVKEFAKKFILDFQMMPQHSSLSQTIDHCLNSLVVNALSETYQLPSERDFSASEWNEWFEKTENNMYLVELIVAQYKNKLEETKEK